MAVVIQVQHHLSDYFLHGLFLSSLPLFGKMVIVLPLIVFLSEISETFSFAFSTSCLRVFQCSSRCFLSCSISFISFCICSISSSKNSPFSALSSDSPS